MLPSLPMLTEPPRGAGSLSKGWSSAPRSMPGASLASADSVGTSSSGRPPAPSTGASDAFLKLPCVLCRWKLSSRPSLVPAAPSTPSAPSMSTNSGLVSRLSRSWKLAWRQAASVLRAVPCQKPTAPWKMLKLETKPFCELASMFNASPPVPAHKMLFRKRALAADPYSCTASPVPW